MSTENISRKSQMDYFWTRMREDVGFVLPHIVNILNMEGLSGNVSLGDLTMTDITSIEKQMRERGEQRVRQEIQNDPEKCMRDFFRDYEETPDQFSFSIGDKFVLRSIVAAVKTNGIGKYIPNSNETETSMDYKNEKESLIARIKEKFSNRSWDDPRNRDIVDSIDKIGIRLERGKGGKVIAWVTCPICHYFSKHAVKELKLIREPTRSWPLYSLFVYFDKHLTSVEQKDRRRKKSRFGLSKVYDQSGLACARLYEQDENSQVFENEDACSENQNLGSDFAKTRSIISNISMQQNLHQVITTERLETSNQMEFDTTEYFDYSEEYLENCDETNEHIISALETSTHNSVEEIFDNSASHNLESTTCNVESLSST